MSPLTTSQSNVLVATANVVPARLYVNDPLGTVAPLPYVTDSWRLPLPVCDGTERSAPTGDVMVPPPVTEPADRS